MISLKIWYLHLANYLKATTYFYLVLLKSRVSEKISISTQKYKIDLPHFLSYEYLFISYFYI